jgi:hypothetical protein
MAMYMDGPSDLSGCGFVAADGIEFGLQLFGEAAAHQVTEIKNRRVRNAIEHLKALAPALDDSSLMELLQMLGDIGLLEPQLVDEAADAGFFALQLLEDPKPHGLAQDPESAGDHL